MDEEGQRDILNKVALTLPQFSLDSKPPEMSRHINGIIRTYTGVDDPFFKEKRISNEHALSLMPKIEKKLAESEDSLLAAIEYAIAGNSIDFGAYRDLDVVKTISEKVTEENSHIKNEAPHLFAYDALKRDLEEAKGLLYIADNAGELVFDFILLRTIHHFYPDLEIIIAVRDRPVLNDVTLEDAELIGLDKEFEVISSGSDAPGTVPRLCNAEFLDLFFRVDTVISKGQGNFETLSEEKRKVFFLLKSKCSVVARHTGSTVGDILLIEGGDIQVT